MTTQEQPSGTPTAEGGPAVRVGPPVVVTRGASRFYGPTRALHSVDLEVRAGEVLGVVGHNGAGKSTLMRVLSGVEAVDHGQVTAHRRTDPATALERPFANVRMAYQETSLAPDLTVVENIYLSARSWLPARGWRSAATRAFSERLGEVFPGQQVDPEDYVADLSLAHRQVVEIVRASLADQLDLLILDEPTESLTADSSVSLYRYVRSLTDQGIGVLLISHRISEVLSVADRIVVMQDGTVVADNPAAGQTEASLLAAMGSIDEPGDTAAHQTTAQAAARGPVRASVRGRAADTGGETPIVVHEGEVIGLAGIAGQGQQEVLEELWQPTDRATSVTGRRAYVPGDRQRTGIFPLWSVADNLGISAMRSLARRGVRRTEAEAEVISSWVDRLRIRGGGSALMTSLSGGNQQKVIVARAFASDASIVLLDDPFRGVDVHTKNDLYRLIRDEVAGGRSVVWYSSDNSEMEHCDRVYVLRAGHVAAELTGHEITEDRIIAESFADIPGSEAP
jgi:ribose transport system ATP-binding protein